MRVLFLCPFYPTKYASWGGVFFRNYARALARRGNEVTVLRVAEHNRNEVRERGRLFVKDREFDEGVETIIFFFPKIPKLEFLTRTLQRFFVFHFYRKKYRMEHPDVIHAHFAEFELSKIAVALKRRFGVPLVITEHSTTFMQSHVPDKVWEKVGPVYAAADVRNAVSTCLTQILNGKTGLDFGVLPNCVDESKFKINSKKVRSERRFLCIGMLVGKKNHIGLLKAFAMVAPEQPGSRLVIAGDGPERASLERYIDLNGLCDVVRMDGMVSNERVIELLAETDYFVLPSFVETFGVVALEALFCGLPVLTTRNGGAETFVKEGENGILCDTGVESIAAGLREIVAREWDPDAIRASVVKEYSMASIGERLGDIYRNVLPKAGKVAR